MLMPNSAFLDLNITDVARCTRCGRLPSAALNAIGTQSQWRLAEVIEDCRAGLHKAKVKWQSSPWDWLRYHVLQTA